MFSKHYIQQIEDYFPVIYPTSTLPALGVLPHEIGLDRLFKMKERDNLKIVSFAVANFQQMEQFGVHQLRLIIQRVTLLQLHRIVVLPHHSQLLLRYWNLLKRLNSQCPQVLKF